jgi:transcriptional regulator with XRE-family HTH domain
MLDVPSNDTGSARTPREHASGETTGDPRDGTGKGPSVSGYDGPTLRSVRESSGVPLRRVARQAGMSHGHLSKVERGEPGRPVTPAVLAAYEKATGIRLTGVAGHGPADADADGGWRRGHLSEARRRTLNAKIAAVAVGGPLGEQVGRILDATGRITVPARIEVPDVVQVERAAALCTTVDMQYGGGVADQMARAMLRWAVGLLETGISQQISPRLHAAIGAIAQRAGWAAFDADSHETARALFTVALYAAGRADDADLRSHVIADLAAQHNFLGYPSDCLQVVRFGEVDERVGPAVKMVLNMVKARAYAVRGDAEACLRHIGQAEDAHAAAAGSVGWLATVATPAQLYAGTGHASATLTRRTRSETCVDAVQRLGRAIDLLDPTGQARSAALCMAQLATLHIEAGELAEGARWARRVLDSASGIRSVRLAEHMTIMRTAAGSHTGDATMRELAADVGAALGLR